MIRAKQTVLYPELSLTSSVKPVNVSSIPQRSPFRYPGGKTWFVPMFRNWLSQRETKPSVLVEPFAGGGIISLTSLFEDLVQSAVMVELDAEVAAVWQTIVDGNSEWLAQRILSFELTKETLIEELSRNHSDVKTKAFHTILKNRTFHGGILAEGAGVLKHGENGKGIRSRWYPETLARRLRAIAPIADRISFRHEDGLEVIKEHSRRKDAVFFIDPPYTAGGKKAGSRLYRHSCLDHETLFSLCEGIKGDFLMTYDDAEEVKQLARKHHFQMRLIPMTNTHHATMSELVISRNFQWLQEPLTVAERAKKICY